MSGITCMLLFRMRILTFRGYMKIVFALGILIGFMNVGVSYPTFQYIEAPVDQNWVCSSCYVTNTESSTHCLGCGSKRSVWP